MKTFLIIAVVLVVAAIWVLRRGVLVAVGGPIPAVSSTVRSAEGALVGELTLSNSTAPHFVTSLSVPRNDAERLQLQPPAGFVAQPLPAEGADPAWVEEWNRENLRFVGRLELVPGVPTRLVMPASAAHDHGVTLKGQFENGRRFGGSIGFFSLTYQPM